MTANDFRAVALSLPESVEGMHMDHPDFRVGGKIFATAQAVFECECHCKVCKGETG